MWYLSVAMIHDVDPKAPHLGKVQKEAVFVSEAVNDANSSVREEAVILKSRLDSLELGEPPCQILRNIICMPYMDILAAASMLKRDAQHTLGPSQRGGEAPIQAAGQISIPRDAPPPYSHELTAPNYWQMRTVLMFVSAKGLCIKLLESLERAPTEGMSVTALDIVASIKRYQVPVSCV
jgi:hypothetical protein